MANEIEKLKVELLDPELVALADKIVLVIEDGKQALAVSINEIKKRNMAHRCCRILRSC